MAQNIIFQVIAETKQFIAGLQGASKEADKTKDKVKEIKNETSELGKVMDGLQSKIAGAFAIGSIIAFGKQVAQIGAVFDNLTIRVNSLAGSVKDGEIAMQSLQNMSKKLGIDLKVLTENYINFVTAAKSSGMAMATAERAFKSMNVAMAGAGVSAQTQTQVFQSLQMMIGKSAVSSMQLKQVFMAMPESFEVMAKTLGVTNKELHKMLKSGEVMAGDVLPEFAKNMELALGNDAQKMAESMQGQINNLTNAFDNLYRTAGDSGLVQGIISGITNSINVLENALIGARAVFATFYAIVDKGEMAMKLEQDIRKKEVRKFEAEMREMGERQAQMFIEREEKKGKKAQEIADQMLANAEAIENSIKNTNPFSEKEVKLYVQRNQEAKALRKLADELLLTSTKQKELTEAELKALREQAKERERAARAEALAAAELNVLKQVDAFDILIAKINEVEVKREQALKKEGLTKSESLLITQKAQDEIDKLNSEYISKQMADIELAAKNEQAVLKARYDERIKDLDYLRGVDAVSEEEYYKEKLRLAEQFGEDIRPLIVAQYAFEERERQKAIQKERDDEKQLQQERQQMERLKIDTADQTFTTLNALNNAYTISQTNQLREQLEKGIISQEQYEQSLRKIKRRQAVLDKAGALFDIALNTSRGIASASATVAGLPLAAVIKALGVAQAAAVIATPIPYNKGTKKVPMVRGAVRGKDSVHAILTPEERVVPADINTQPGYSALMDLAHDRKISDKEAGFIAKLATGSVRSGGVDAEPDYNQLGKAIAKYIPHTDVTIDHNGIAVITDRSHANMNRLKTRL